MTPRRALPLLILAAAIILGAVLQAATAVPGIGRAAPTTFLLAAAASVATLWAQVTALAWATAAFGRPAASVRLAGVAMWSGIVVLLAGTLLVIAPLAAILIGLAALFILPATVAGVDRTVPEAARTLRRHPWRAIVLALGALIAVAVLAVGAAATGLFLTGFFGGVAMWIAFGTAGAVLLGAAGRLQRV
jgi:hypothetical protein